MSADTIKIRIMKVADFNAVVRIDEKVMKVPRTEYYKLKFEELVQSTDRLPTSLVAEREDGTVVGFVMGALFIGEYGISRDATLDTIGVDPDYQGRGVGKQLMTDFMDHLRALGAQKVNTLVDSNDAKMSHFFKSHQFGPSQTINLERSLLR
ncbi:MAG TPA: GNAT family N-acetyltransferase [Syntrophorhabdales bacterium]|nr:GNAT family N-acetyltransferase [Syntrophorhabdales bacterium]